jgi:hypothetical protein
VLLVALGTCLDRSGLPPEEPAVLRTAELLLDA